MTDDQRVGPCGHHEAMALIRDANTVTTLSYEEAIAVYLRARGILNDGADMLGTRIPREWEPKEQMRRLQETIDRKQAAKLVLQKTVAELEATIAAIKNPKGAVVEAAVNNGTGHYIVGDPARVIEFMLAAVQTHKS